jgi:putative tryptophan/tyrosine transport system substrate-binding protein
MRRWAILLGALYLLGRASPGDADVKTPGIGFIEAGWQQANQIFLDSFRDGLRTHGWIDRNNVVILDRWAEARNDRLPEIIAELIQSGVDVLVTNAPPATVAAERATGVIPIVMVGPGDPVGMQIVESLARPGGNVTGLSSMSFDVNAKQLQLLKEILPTLSRVAAVRAPGDAGEEQRWQLIRTAADTLGVALLSLEVATQEDIERAFARLRTESCDGLFVAAGGLTLANRARIVALADELHLPAVYPFRGFPVAGGLMSYGTDYADLNRRAASYVDKILKGVKPADLPVEQPTKFELVINLRTAKALGVAIPQSILGRADELIE